MRLIPAALRAAWNRWRDAMDVRSARSFHRAMGHCCDFCRYSQPKRPTVKD